MRLTLMTSMLLVALAGSAAAQQASTTKTVQPRVGLAPQTAAARPATPVSPEQLTTQAESIVRRGESISQSVRGMLEEARKEADIIKVTCLDDKLTQVDVAVRTAEGRLGALKTAVDSDRRMHEFTVLTVLGQKLQVLDQEAHQCVGQAMYETGKTKVVTQIDTNSISSETTPTSFPVITPGTGSIPVIPPVKSGQN